MHNVRVLRNMMINSASHAFCNQPVARRADLLDSQHRLSPAWRIDAADHGSAGVLFYNNTILSETAAQRRVERALAQQPVPRRELGAGDLQRQHLHELHLVRLQRLPSEPGRGRRRSQWNVAAVQTCGGFQRMAPGAGAAASSKRASFATLADYSEATGQDQHSVLVDYDVFVNVPRLDAQDRKTVQKVYKAEDFDFRLKPGVRRRSTRRRAAERERWVCGTGAGSRRARGRAATAALRTARELRRAARPGWHNALRWQGQVGRLQLRICEIDD